MQVFYWPYINVQDEMDKLRLSGLGHEYALLSLLVEFRNPHTCCAVGANPEESPHGASGPKRSGLNANGSGLGSGLHLVRMGPSMSEVESDAIVAVQLHGGLSWGASGSVAVASIWHQAGCQAYSFPVEPPPPRAPPQPAESPCSETLAGSCNV